MKRLIVMGSMAAGILLVSTMFFSVACAQAVNSDEINTSILQYIKDIVMDSTWQPGQLLAVFVYLLIFILLFPIYWGM
jgi:hypothetical protein